MLESLVDKSTQVEGFNEISNQLIRRVAGTYLLSVDTMGLC